MRRLSKLHSTLPLCLEAVPLDLQRLDFGGSRLQPHIGAVERHVLGVPARVACETWHRREVGCFP